MNASASPAACKCAAIIFVVILVGFLATVGIQRVVSPTKKVAATRAVAELPSAGAADASPAKLH